MNLLELLLAIREADDNNTNARSIIPLELRVELDNFIALVELGLIK